MFFFIVVKQWWELIAVVLNFKFLIFKVFLNLKLSRLRPQFILKIFWICKIKQSGSQFPSISPRNVEAGARQQQKVVYFSQPLPLPLTPPVWAVVIQTAPPAHWWVECDPIPTQKLEDLLLGTFKENPHFFLSFLLYSFYCLSHTKNRKERKEKERQETQWEDRKFVLQMIFLFILRSCKQPATSSTSL